LYLNIIRSISVVFNASLPFFIHSFRFSIFDGRYYFCAALPASRSVTLSAEQLLHFSFLSIFPVFVFDLDVVIGFYTFFFWQDCLFWLGWSFVIHWVDRLWSVRLIVCNPLGWSFVIKWVDRLRSIELIIGDQLGWSFVIHLVDPL
jgi:hypothetical protein